MKTLETLIKVLKNGKEIEIYDNFNQFILEIANNKNMSHILNIGGDVNYIEYDNELECNIKHYISSISVNEQNKVIINTDDKDGYKFILATNNLPIIAISRLTNHLSWEIKKMKRSKKTISEKDERENELYLAAMLYGVDNDNCEI